ncbi:hypothetical protein [Microbacterium capsulatum]|uniref:DNA-binding transcriptional regulator, MarR family n=1 Tax=Microbacterium capsulatum TaxID=3041921 RepID=A0ABU0XIH8_9MICO|nr:hypothetical protein [Microbacterium sp. ASV81]MDQ4214947.1 hypothetical protein [Microbacterium sp. ASV81]
MNTPDDTPAPSGRPFGFWITAVDRLVADRFATAFEDEGITRREWRILNLLDGTVPADRVPHGPKLRRLAELGWIERGDPGWTLTAPGAAAKARLTSAVSEIHAQVAGILDEDEFTAMAASLEKLARGLGWQEGTRLPRRPRAERAGRGSDPRGSGRLSGFDPREHHAEFHRRFGHGRFGRPEFGPHPHGHGDGHGEDCDRRAAFEHGLRHGHAPSEHTGFEQPGFEQPDFGHAGFGQPGFGGRDFPHHGGRRGPGNHLHIHLHD